MQTLSEIRALLASRGLRPKHRLGQNFLHDQNQLRRLIEAARIESGDLVLEIGPGTGTLTEALLDAGAEVIACELDADMAAIVGDRCRSPQLTLIRGDALSRQRQLNADLTAHLRDRPFRLVANLPYQIASPLMTTLLIDHPECTGQHVTIQKEVADRLLAKPSTKEYGPLSVIMQALATVERIATLAPSCFWPEPEVTSAMISILPRSEAQGIVCTERREFARFVTQTFTKRRKQLGAIIGRSHAAWPMLATLGITPDLRPETLDHAKMATLWRSTRTQASSDLV